MARAPVFLVQKLLPLMSRGGSIILVGSAMHLMGIPNRTAYAATKAATRSYARTWAAEFKGRSIRVNTLSPGVTDTPILDAQSKAAGRDEVVEDVPRPSAVTTACDQVGGFTSLSSRSSGLVTSPIALTATRA